MTAVRTESTVDTLRRSPLSDRQHDLHARSSNQVLLAEEAFLTQVNLRVGPASCAVARIERALELRLPRRPGTVTGDEHRAMLWLGPNEWLVIAPAGQAATIVRLTRAAIGDSAGSTVDVSANRTALRLGGRVSRDVLEKVCALDLHPRAFGPGQCAQTLIGRTQAILWQLTAEPAYRILVRCSFASYLADVLLDAMSEFTAFTA